MIRRAVLFAGLVVALTACRASPEDVARWETSEDGPERLAKVVRDDGAAIALRRDAALALVRLERRNRRVGLPMLADALAASTESGRANVVEAIGPELIAETGRARVEDSPDPSLPAKDALHLLLARGLVADAGRSAAFRGALLAWVRTSLPDRMTDRTQRYSLPETVRLLGPGASRGVLTLAGPHGSIERIARVLREVDGDADRRADGDELAAILRGAPWRERDMAAILDANRRAKVRATQAQVEQQLSVYSRDGIKHVTAAMVALGGTSIGTILDLAEDTAAPDDRRATLLGVLASNAGSLDPPAIDRLFTIAAAPTTGRDARTRAFEAIDAFVDRLSTTPRLWALLARGGGVRLGAANVLLHRIKAGEVDAFLRAVTVPGVAGAGSAEPLAYGPELVKLVGRDALLPYLKDKRTSVRVIALAALAGDQTTLRPFESDGAPLPACAVGYDWHDCVSISSLSAGAGPDLSARAERDPVATVGAFVCTCLHVCPRVIE
jgi:hypothetical protein